MVGNAKESSSRGRKPSAVRVRSAAENFAAHAASPYRPRPHYFRYIKTARNGRSFAWSFFRLCGRFSYKTARRGKNKSKYNPKTPFPLPFGMRQILFRKEHLRLIRPLQNAGDDDHLHGKRGGGAVFRFCPAA